MSSDCCSQVYSTNKCYRLGYGYLFLFLGKRIGKKKMSKFRSSLAKSLQIVRNLRRPRKGSTQFGRQKHPTGKGKNKYFRRPDKKLLKPRPGKGSGQFGRHKHPIAGSKKRPFGRPVKRPAKEVDTVWPGRKIKEVGKGFMTGIENGTSAIIYLFVWTT